MASPLDRVVQPGRLEDTYEVGKHLGSGAFSEVKQCTEIATGLVCAVKIIGKHDKEFDEELLALEVELMLRLKGHANVVKIFAVYGDDEAVYIVMEHMAGGELFDIIVRRVDEAARDDPRPYSEQHVAKIMYQLTSAIVHCHTNLVCHRDLKPENMLIASQDSDNPDTPIKLGDFGLSADITKETLMHEPCGTPEYVAPEVVMKFQKGYGKACDIWSLGVIMYVLLCGYAPFWGKNAAEILRRVKTATVDYPEREWAHVSEEAKKVLASMLNRDPDKRPTAAALLDVKWMRDHEPASAATSKRALPEALRNLKRFNAKRKFRASIEAIYAEGKMEQAIHGLRVEAMTVDMLKGETLESVRHLAAAFKAAGMDASERMGQKQFISVLRQHFDMGDKEATRHFDAFCAYKNSPTITYPEYCQACVAVTSASSADKIDLAFELYDVDNNGFINFEEFSNLARNIIVGAVLHENKLQAMIKDEFTEADKDGGGTITLVEWRAAAHDQSRLRRYFRSISSLHTLSTSAREVKSAGDRVAKIDEAKRTKSSLGIVSMEAEDGAHPLNRSDSV